MHVDLWGPSAVTSAGGARYFLGIVDDYSRWVTVYPLKDKTETVARLQEFTVEIEKQVGGTLFGGCCFVGWSDVICGVALNFDPRCRVVLRSFNVIVYFPRVVYLFS